MAVYFESSVVVFLFVFVIQQQRDLPGSVLLSGSNSSGLLTTGVFSCAGWKGCWLDSKQRVAARLERPCPVSLRACVCWLLLLCAGSGGISGWFLCARSLSLLVYCCIRQHAFSCCMLHACCVLARHWATRHHCASVCVLWSTALHSRMHGIFAAQCV